MKQFTDQILLAVYFDKNSKFCAVLTKFSFGTFSFFS